MTETIKVFACPKCGLIIDHGINPCPYCKTQIAWEGTEKLNNDQGQSASDTSQQQVQQVQNTVPQDVQMQQTIPVQPAPQVQLTSQVQQVQPAPQVQQAPADTTAGMVVSAATGAAIGSVSGAIVGGAPGFGVEQNPQMQQVQQVQQVQPTQQFSQVQATQPVMQQTPPPQMQQAQVAPQVPQMPQAQSAPQAPDYQTPIVEIDYSSPVAQPEMQGQQQQQQQFSPFAQQSNDQLLSAASAPVLDSVDYAQQDVVITTGSAGQYVAGDPNSYVQVQAPQLQVPAQSAPPVTQAPPSFQPEQSSQGTYGVQAPPVLHLDQAPAYNRGAQILPTDITPADVSVTSATGAPLAADTTSATNTGIPQAAATTAAVLGTTAVVAAATNATTIVPTDADTTIEVDPIAATPASTKPASGLPDMPPIKQAGTSSPHRKRKRSAGVTAVSMIMKFIAVVMWVVAIVLLVGSWDALVSAFSSFTLDSLVGVLTGNSVVSTSLSLIVLGFLFFGVAVIIGLLGDIRRGAR